MMQLSDKSKMDDGGNYYCALGWAFADGKGRPEVNYTKEKQIFPPVQEQLFTVGKFWMKSDILMRHILPI